MIFTLEHRICWFYSLFLETFSHGPIFFHANLGTIGGDLGTFIYIKVAYTQGNSYYTKYV